MDFKLLLSPLVSYDINRSIRAIKSCFLQRDFSIPYGVHVVINSLDENLISEVSEYCRNNKIDYTVTPSDGTPSTGKNWVFKIFEQSEFTHLAQLDGDDFFYPTFVKHIQRHLIKFVTTDVLAALPNDAVIDYYLDGAIKMKNENYAVLWTTGYINWETQSIIGRDRIFDGVFGNYARFILFSKKISKNFKYDPTFVVGEDVKMHFDFLHAYQKDDISYWFTTASDTSVKDTTSFGIQKQAHGSIVDGKFEVLVPNELITRLQDHVKKNMIENRSAPCEIPIDFTPFYMNLDEKISFIQEIF